MPATVRERMERGPRGDRLPPRRDRVLAAVVAFALFAAAGFLAWTAFRPTRGVVGGESTPQVVVTFTETGPDSEFPTAMLVLGDEAVEGMFGSYCWFTGNEFTGNERCIDTVAPEFTDFLAVPRGSELVVRGTAESVAGSLGETKLPFEPVVKLDLADGSAVLDAEPAKYVLSFVAHWPQGNVPFYFAVEIVPPTEATPSAVVTETPTPTETASPEPTEAADVLRVACRPDGTAEVLTPVVSAQPDGLHVLVDDQAGSEAVVVRQPSRPGFAWSSGSSGLDDEFVMLVPPGESYVGCFAAGWAPAAEGPSAAPGEAAFIVVDPDGYWVSTDPTCPASTWEGFHVNWQGDAGATRAEAVLRYVPGILPVDTVEAAGYTGSPHQREVVRVVRSGEIVAWVMAHNLAGSWSFDGYTCPGSGIGA